ncbi:MAG: cyclic pyranopterin monophosphate synthase MoaC [Acidobacteria bacterium]|nr:cyclic pyranopterin monophosphate synthase MoaC [Acidobacteriota bacterium]MBI3658286.1 cyclic pyranopterin monophosphate synthase MoaC [Acidobacteriota bacterium]
MAPAKNRTEMKLTHMDEQARARMVDVTAKPSTDRVAIAKGLVVLSRKLMTLLRRKQLPKGDPFETARIAGVMAAKKTAELIPLCHSLALSHINVDLTWKRNGLEITATVRCPGATGVEMEALTAVAVAALTLYDMCKAVDKGIVISDIRLMEKQGGSRGHYVRQESL